ncbi:hypothetical protein CK203_025462 [Vitis vinifera]|uniref:Uncharacterized protein n=1 Tax=Vitis vinifera TaxID=29760 RepID=A0A438IZM2_VITVI|nr:hypothetical protein CK203_025462 [Vitis vinifera]
MALDKALLGKWSWRFVVERESFWKQVIINKFGLEEGGWCSRGARGGYDVKFWKDLRCENQTLKEVSPNLYQLAVNKDEWVSDAWEGSGELGSWNPHFSTHFNDWELEEVEGLFRKLQPLVLMRVSFFACKHLGTEFRPLICSKGGDGICRIDLVGKLNFEQIPLSTLQPIVPVPGNVVEMLFFDILLSHCKTATGCVITVHFQLRSRKLMFPLNRNLVCRSKRLLRTCFQSGTAALRYLIPCSSVHMNNKTSQGLKLNPFSVRMQSKNCPIHMIIDLIHNFPVDCDAGHESTKIAVFTFQASGDSMDQSPKLMSCKSYDFFAARYARQRSEINNVANGGQDEG